ncbi:TolC family protein [Segetibacter sp.]|jgi:multidrug efflux system outer membrane protein|uniref:TolC family protein n=1 Tax=Segetibacter sp. TaxID=2231182 RepID=UPI0026052714|nr:TolC family protein [Segetibacter sp.]MCW3078677.1 transporter [Segetibacter sp.]
MKRSIKTLVIIASATITSCSTIKQAGLPNGVQIPKEFTPTTDTAANPFAIKDFFADATLQRLIDTALASNYDLKVAVQRIEIARANTRIAEAARLPVVNAVIGAAVDRYGQYTMNGVGNFDTNKSPNINKKQRIPTPTPDYFLGFRSTWEVDIWGKLKDRRRAAYTRYLASEKGRQWLATQIVSEVAGRYYELLALDNQLRIIARNIDLQKRGLEIVEAQMAGGRATALAVRQFKAQVLNTQGAEIDIRQSVQRTENELNNLLGRFPAPVARDTSIIAKVVPQQIGAGIPSEVLLRRPDVQQAELELIAAKADIDAARKAFLPSLNFNPYVGLNAFKAPLLLSTGSIAAGLASSLAAPVINRRGIMNGVNIANAEQATAFYNYQKNIVQGYQEVLTQLQSIENLKKAYHLKVEEVETLTEGVATANDLYLAGYASYLEVIVAQGSVLQAEMQQTNIKREIFTSIINLYRALGGG